MSATFQRECLGTLWGEVTPLLVEHYREIAMWQDIELAPDIELYELVEEHDQYRAFTARVDGALVGYAGFFVRPAIHYRHSLQATQDVVFVQQRYRCSRIGWRLLRYAETSLLNEGVQVAHHHVKVAHPILGGLLQHMGYQIAETILVKRLDGGSR